MPEYGELWQPGDEQQAMQLVLNESDAAVFEASGQRQAEDILCPRIAPTDVVLDLGCGIGRVARYVAGCCGRLWVVDASERMLALARERSRACRTSTSRAPRARRSRRSRAAASTSRTRS